MSNTVVTKLNDGGYDVTFVGGGRVILNASEASNKDEAVKVASERLKAAGRVGDDDSTPASADTNQESGAQERAKATQSDQTSSDNTDTEQKSASQARREAAQSAKPMTTQSTTKTPAKVPQPPKTVGGDK